MDYVIYAQALPLKHMVQNVMEYADVSVALRHFGLSDLAMFPSELRGLETR